MLIARRQPVVNAPLRVMLMDRQVTGVLGLICRLEHMSPASSQRCIMTAQHILRRGACLKKEGEARVTVGNVEMPLGSPPVLGLHQLHDDAPQCGQRAVDANGLLEMLPPSSTGLVSLTPCACAIVTQPCWITNMQHMRDLCMSSLQPSRRGGGGGGGGGGGSSTRHMPCGMSPYLPMQGHHPRQAHRTRAATSKQTVRQEESSCHIVVYGSNCCSPSGCSH